MNLSLIVDTEGTIPLYQQLKHQLLYLISSRQIPQGEQLPAIRELAESLQINIGTVAQAYRELQAEGLIESIKGRGTFVCAVLPPRFTEEAITRQDALTSTLTDMLGRAFSMGFAAVEIQQRIASLLNQGPWYCRLVFVGPTPEISRKHASLVEENLGLEHVRVHHVDIDSLRKGDLPEHFQQTHYVLTFRGLLRSVEQALTQLPGRRTVLAVSTRVSDYTIGALAILPASLGACLISEDHNRHSALNLITTHSRLPRDIPTAAPEATELVARLCEQADIVVHTFSSNAVLDELGVAKGKRLELRFETDPESLANVRSLIQPLSLAAVPGSS
jgi:DNA-binding transcriptional regulator YhcF (GntR family)